jgi:hypothetical protein
MFCYGLPCAAMCRCVPMCDYVLLATMSTYWELKSDTMCYYVLLCVTICNYV